MPTAIFDSDLLTAEGMLIGPANNLLYVIAECIAAERERCALVAEHLNGWGTPPSPELARHIAKTIRETPRDTSLK